MAAARSIGVKELKRRLDAKRPFVLLDVLPAEVFRDGRLPGAVNACIYEVTFLDQVGSLVPDRRTPIVTYCEGPASRASADAAERLLGAGYADVRRFKGGREAWREAGHPFEGREAPPPEGAPRDGEYAVDTARSLVAWVGRNPGGSHDGTLRFLGGRIVVARGVIAEAAFEIDMKSIEISDLAGEMAGLLLRHLESEDFFAVAAHPVARLAVTRVAAIHGATPGAPNFEVEAELSMRGVTNPVAFPATVAVRAGGEIALEAHFDVDRTRWNVNYGSGKLYARLGMHLVHDHITLEARIYVNG